MRVNTKEYMLEIGKNDPNKDYKAFIYRHYLEYEDAKGAYKIYIGRGIRKKLITLFKRDGSVDRGLEIDLESGVVYYDIEPETSGAVAYFYDTANRRVDNFEIRKLLYYTKGTPFEPDPQTKAILQKLPCDNWVEELSKIPGWEEDINNQYKKLFLPHEPATQLTLTEADLAAPDAVLTLPGGHSYPWKSLKSIKFNYKVKISRKVWHTEFVIYEKNGKPSIRYQSENIGAEFFHEDELYERYLNDTEFRWIVNLFQEMIPDETPVPGLSEEEPDTILLDFGEEAPLGYRAKDPELVKKNRETILKFLKREIEVSK